MVDERRREALIHKGAKVQFKVGQLVYWGILREETELGIIKRVDVGMTPFGYEVYWFGLERSLAGYRAIELLPANSQTKRAFSRGRE